ncbi:P27 family phage terminase small subunit [Vibrio vulnificus]|nr:P27 family phage terminase small subunit [Vibrio vulnificus]
MIRDIHLNVPLSDDQYKTFLNIKKLIESERELQPTDYEAVAMLVVNISLLRDALDSINNDGAIIYSQSRYGTTPKSNPSNEIAFKANVAIKGYLEALLLTPKSKALINKTLNEKPEEDDDPLTQALRQRASRKI